MTTKELTRRNAGAGRWYRFGATNPANELRKPREFVGPVGLSGQRCHGSEIASVGQSGNNVHGNDHQEGHDRSHR